MADTPGATAPDDPAGPGRRRWPRRLAALVAVVAVVGGVLFWRSTIPWTPPDFYAAPEPLPDGPAGTLIRSEPITSGVPDGAVAHRVLYRSIDHRGEPVAVSGIVVAPAEASEAPRPVIAWANGSLGVRSECGTSHTRRPFDQIPELELLIREGYVVAATDYPGRGTAGTHPYLLGRVEAAAVLDSVRAARALTGASERFVTWGRSQGGHAALWTAQEAAAYAPELTLLGVAAAAPAIDLPGILRNGMTTLGGAVVISQALYAWSRIDPAVDLDVLIRPELRDRFERVATTCLTTPTAFLLLGELPRPVDYLATDPLADPALVELIEENVPTAPIPAPILVSHGTGDTLIPSEGSEADVARRCDMGESVLLMRYPGVQHDAADVSAVATIGWIGDIVAGRTAPTSCAG